MSPLSPGLYLIQRLSALVMAPLALGHIAVMIVAIQGGLDSAEILSRTRGNLFWGAFYELFVIAVSIHAALGIRVIAFEWCNIKQQIILEAITWSSWLLLLLMGTYAVIGVVSA